MKKFVLFYVNAGYSVHEYLVFDAKNLNSAFAFAKRFCKNHNKTLLGVVDYFPTLKYILL